MSGSLNPLGGRMQDDSSYMYDCISTYISWCEKDINNDRKLSQTTGRNNKHMINFAPTKPIEQLNAQSEIKIEEIRTFSKESSRQTVMFTKSSYNIFHPTDFLLTVAPNISRDLISSQNFNEIQNLAKHLKEGVTSFFGFEFHLTSPKARSDYLVAVSSQKKEREALLNALDNLPENLSQQKEWQQVRRLTEQWVNPNSILHNNILGLWLEFDTSNEDIGIPVPNIFLQTIPLRIDTPEDVEKCIWVTRVALPVLTGSKVPEQLENKFIDALKKLPKGASVFHVASMLARGAEGMRLIIKRIKPEDIVPYLKSIGWEDSQDNGLTVLLNDVKKFSNCIRLHINIGDHIDPKIGLECFISPDRYHEGEGWNEFFNYLVSKNMCLPHLSSALLAFPGVIQEDQTEEFSLDSYMPSVKIEGNNFSKALVRYISHVKLSYEPGRPLEAKAYTGVRLFGKRQ